MRPWSRARPARLSPSSSTTPKPSSSPPPSAPIPFVPPASPRSASLPRSRLLSDAEPNQTMNPNASSPSNVASAACASTAASASNSAYLFLLVFSAALGGLLFGYDTAVVSGAEKLLQKHFALNAVQTGWAASCVLIGCLFGALIAGPLADWGGRKKILITCAVLFTLSALGCAIPEKLNDLGLQSLGVGFNQLVTWVGSV